MEQNGPGSCRDRSSIRNRESAPGISLSSTTIAPPVTTFQAKVSGGRSRRGQGQIAAGLAHLDGVLGDQPYLVALIARLRRRCPSWVSPSRPVHARARLERAARGAPSWGRTAYPPRHRQPMPPSTLPLVRCALAAGPAAAVVGAQRICEADGRRALGGGQLVGSRRAKVADRDQERARLRDRG